MRSGPAASLQELGAPDKAERRQLIAGPSGHSLQLAPRACPPGREAYLPVVTLGLCDSAGPKKAREPSMERREFMTTLGAAAAVLSAIPALAESAAGVQHMHPPKYKAL